MKKMKWIGSVGALVLGGLATAVVAPAPVVAAEVSHHSHNLLGESVGAAGYDPVSYFPEGGGRPQKGLISISLEQNGITYRFASEANKALFQKTPARFVPQYGGWCAWAVAEINKRVDVDPESFVVRDGRLYLFYRDAKLDTRAMWTPKAAELIQKAEANWPILMK